MVPYDLVLFVQDNGKLPVANFAAGGVATPADAALMMQLGAEGVFVGSGGHQPTGNRAADVEAGGIVPSKACFPTLFPAEGQFSLLQKVSDSPLPEAV